MKTRIETHGPFELRFYDMEDGKGEILDEVIMHDKDGNCLFHLEQMDDHYYWMGLYGPDNWIAHVNVGAFEGSERSTCRAFFQEAWKYDADERLMYPQQLKEGDEILIEEKRGKLAKLAKEWIEEAESSKDEEIHPKVMEHWKWLSSLA